MPVDALTYESVVSILGRRTTAHIDRDLGAEDLGIGKLGDREGSRGCGKEGWLRFLLANLVTTSKALVTSSVALVTIEVF